MHSELYGRTQASQSTEVGRSKTEEFEIRFDFFFFKPTIDRFVPYYLIALYNNRILGSNNLQMTSPYFGHDQFFNECFYVDWIATITLIRVRIVIFFTLSVIINIAVKFIKNEVLIRCYCELDYCI